MTRGVAHPRDEPFDEGVILEDRLDAPQFFPGGETVEIVPE